ncbi:MAG: fibronectin type III-like domain-contianing protein, partial [Clostridia bacterium]|nr:fibronectin type III-like domain-contianing protein [Clostridia bacterium]
PRGGLKRPVRELKRFEKVELLPGETKTVSFTLDKRCFAAWDVRMHDWYTEEGDYSVQICSDARTVLLESKLHVAPDKAYQPEFSLNSTLGEILATEKGKAILGGMMNGSASSEYASDIMSPEALAAFINDMPLRQLKSFLPGNAAEIVEGILYQLNH